jgi:putative intracellular protease/amidase
MKTVGILIFNDVEVLDVADLDLCVIPGGWGTRREVNNLVLLQKISKLSTKSTLTASVCTG